MSRTLSIVFLGTICFIAGVGNEFIGDDRAILDHRIGVPTWHDFPEFFLEPYWGDLYPTGLYRPVGLSILALQRYAFGDWTVGYHLVSLFAHVVCSLGVLRLLLKLVGPTTAWISGALFACHPVHAEAALPVYGQLDLFSTALALLLLNIYIVQSRSGWRVWALATLGVLYVLALGCKESVIVLPAIAILIRGLYLCRPQVGLHRWIGRPDLVLFATLAVFLCVRWWVIGSVTLLPHAEVSEGYPLTWRLKLVLVGLAHALRLSILPWGQTIHYGHLREVVFGYPVNEALWVLAALVVLVWTWKLSDRRLWLMSVGWFLVGLFPVLNIVPIGAVVAERFLYLPSVGVALLLGHLLTRTMRWRTLDLSLVGLHTKQPATTIVEHTERAHRRRGGHGPAFFVATAAVVVAVGTGVVLCVRVCDRWQTRESLWRSTVTDHPRSPQAHAALGMVLLDRYQQQPIHAETLREAQTAFRTCLALNPRSPRALHGLGLVEIVQGNYASAASYLRQAVDLRPDDPAIGRQLERCILAASRGRLP